MQKIIPNLWYDGNAEEAAEFYVSVFTSVYGSKDTKVGRKIRHGEGGMGPAGTVVTVELQLHGMEFVGINGGPEFKFSEAVSFLVNVETQQELDQLWGKLSASRENEQCGWLKDKFGMSWQIVPSVLYKLITDPDKAKADRAMQAMLQMKKLDIRALEKAAAG